MTATFGAALSYETEAEARQAAKRFEVANVFYTPFYARHWFMVEIVFDL